MSIAAALDHSPSELIAVVLSRQMRPGEVAIMGAVSAVPQAACRLAQQTSAPGLWFIAGGSGAVNPRLDPLVASSCDERLLSAECVLPLPDVILLEGRGDLIDVFFAGGVQIDAHGNCNLGPVGDWRKPSLRGPGGVGLPFVARAGRVVIYTTSHDRRTFVPHVDFISGPGFPATDGGGPSLIVTPLCTMDFDTAGHVARLASIHPGVTLEQVLEATGFDPIVPAHLPMTPPPTHEELRILRQIDGAGLLRGDRA